MSKIYLDKCHYCHESKAAIKHSQAIKDPIFCVGMSGYESPEVDWERDRHAFVITQKLLDAEAEDWKEYGRQMGEMAEFMDKELKATP